MQSDGGAQKVQHGEHRQWHWDKEKRTTQQGDFPASTVKRDATPLVLARGHSSD